MDYATTLSHLKLKGSHRKPTLPDKTFFDSENHTFKTQCGKTGYLTSISDFQ